MLDSALTFDALKQSLPAFPPNGRLFSSHLAYQRAVHRFFAWWDRDPERPFTAQLIVHYLHDLQNRGEPLSVASINFYMTALRCFCTWLVNAGYLRSSPMVDMAGLPLETLPLQTRLAEQQLQLLLKTFDRAIAHPIKREMACRNYTIMILSARLGLRLPDLLALRHHHFHNKKDRSLLVAGGKQYPLQGDALAALQEYLELHRSWHETETFHDNDLENRDHPLFAKRIAHSSDRPLPHWRCQSLSPDGARAMIAAYLQQAGLAGRSTDSSHQSYSPDALRRFHQEVSPAENMKLRAEHFIPDFTKGPKKRPEGSHANGQEISIRSISKSMAR